jgi:RNA polymerase sigma-70 factor (ECF subfamily)
VVVASMRALAIERTGVLRPDASSACQGAWNSGMTVRRVVPDEPDEAILRAEAAAIDAVRAGDAAAFDDLVERHMRRAFAVAYRVLGHRQDAEDVVQESFLGALQKIDTFERGRRFGPWLLRIVANRAINSRKARALRQTDEIPPGVVSRGESPAQAAERGELRRALERALAQLPDQQRWVVQLFELDGFSGAEIADMLEMPEGTVRWHLHEARRSLRTALGHLASRTS